MDTFPDFVQAISLAYGIGIVTGTVLYVFFEAVDYFKERR